MLRHSVDDLRRRARARKDVGLKPRDMLKSCHWMDLLLCCLEARDAAQLFREIVADLDGRDEEARVRALGRYDCLVWARLRRVRALRLDLRNGARLLRRR